MNNRKKSDDPIHCVREALACARMLRVRADEAGDCLRQAAHRSLQKILAAFGDPGGFSEAFLVDLREVIERFDGWVLAGTTVDFETHDAWNERGAETTAIHPVELLTPEAQRLAILLPELRRLSGLIEATLDLLEAESIVLVLRRQS